MLYHVSFFLGGAIFPVARDPLQNVQPLRTTEIGPVEGSMFVGHELLEEAFSVNGKYPVPRCAYPDKISPIACTEHCGALKPWPKNW